MKNECVYDIIRTNSGRPAAEITTDKSAKRSYIQSAKIKNVLPTASTFINHTSFRPGVANLGGDKNPFSIAQNHKGGFANFGLPKDFDQNKIKNRASSNYKASRIESATESKKLKIKSDLPKPNELAITGLKTSNNFIKENIVRAKSAKINHKVNKKNIHFDKYRKGVVPTYLEGIKKVLEKEKEYLQIIKDTENYEEPTVEEPSCEDLSTIKKNLRSNLNILNTEYQSIAHLGIKLTHVKKRRNEQLEKQMKEIEKHIDTLSKNIIVNL